MQTIRLQSSALISWMSNSSSPIPIEASLGTWLTIATFGVSGPRLSANPIRTAITIG